MRTPMRSGFRRATRRRSEPMVILAVADAAMGRRYVACLAESGFTTARWSHGDDAIAIVRRLFTDFVVLDSEVAELRALELVRRLRDDDATNGIGVVALSRGVTPYREDLARQAGCDALLEASCPPEMLLTEPMALYAQLDLPGEERPSARMRCSER